MTRYHYAFMASFVYTRLFFVAVYTNIGTYSDGSKRAPALVLSRHRNALLQRVQTRCTSRYNDSKQPITATNNADYSDEGFYNGDEYASDDSKSNADKNTVRFIL